MAGISNRACASNLLSLHHVPRVTLTDAELNLKSSQPNA